MFKAQVIADTIKNNARITTIEIVAPRFILPQINTHRVFSRNTASSRAIPVARQLAQVTDNPVIPVRFGVNQSGMVAEHQLEGKALEAAQAIWLEARDNAVKSAQALADLGVHKEVANRLIEPFNWAKTLITATEWENFFELRLAHDAQPEIQHIARLMKEAMDKSEPVENHYHLPFISEAERGVRAYRALAMVSAARCARISYDNHDKTQPSYQADYNRAEKLLAAKHLSPFEHQASAAKNTNSNNFKNWVQFRAEICI